MAGKLWMQGRAAHLGPEPCEETPAASLIGLGFLAKQQGFNTT